MRGERRALAVASAAIVLSVANVPGLAQSNAVRWRTATLESTARLAPAGVGVYLERYPAADDVDIPANLNIPASYRTTIAAMLERSAMFRRQCLRLAAAPQLAIVVRMLHPVAGGPRARTQITRQDEGRLLAVVELNPGGDFTELLAHEFEHVIEQLDGIDLAAKAELANTGVHSCVGGFETSRAVRVGTVVALETRGR
jgi:hypothetical protein